MKDWVKLDKNRWENNRNGAFIARFNFGLRIKPYRFLVYINKANYQKSGADYETFMSLSDAKVFGNDIENSTLIDITKPQIRS